MLNPDLRYDPATLRLGIYPREMKTPVHVNTRPRMLMAVLFVTARKQKRPRRPPAGERVNDTWPSHKMEYYLAIGHKKE